MRVAGIIGLLAGWLASPALAQDRLAYVLAATEGQEAARADAMAVSRALIGAGVSVIRRENADPSSFDLGAVAPLTLLYFSGPTAIVGGETWLLAGVPEAVADGNAAPRGWPLYATLAGLKARGALQVVAVVQGCHQPGPGFAPPPLPPLAVPVLAPVVSPLDPEAPPAVVPAPDPLPDPLDDILILLASDPAQPCASAGSGPRLTDRFLAATASGADDLAAAFASQPGQGWMENRLRHRLPAPMRLPPVQTTGAADVAAVLRSLPQAEATRLQGLWAANAATLGDVSPLIPAGASPAPSPLISNDPSPLLAPSPTPASARNGATTGAGGLRLVEVSARALLAARPTAAGLPRPSVIVGDLAPTEASFASDSADQPGTSLYGMAAAERIALRAQDAAGFAALVDSGAFDPAPGEVAAALQTELARMNCYTARVDGDWGNGSRGAVDRYFTARRVQATTREATLDLYRNIIGAEDVACPVVREAEAPQARQQGTTRRSTGQAAAPTRRATAAPAAPAAPKPAAPKPRSGGLNAGALGTGVLR